MSILSFDPRACTLCPRMCRADRTKAAGRCRMPEAPVLARAALHRWEEPPLSGTRGAGTVFFSGCSLGCVFCQNYEISQEDKGKAVTPARLRAIFFELIHAGAHNIDLVNPSHYAHVVLEALSDPLPVPVVWNSGGYDRVETLRALEGKVQIYLPDYKYPDEAGARRYSGAADYPEIARAAIAEMVRQTGPYALDGDGLLTRGVVIRHLLLPGRLAQAKEVMDWVASAFPPKTVLFSLMSQYTPMPGLERFPELRRTVSAEENENLIHYLQTRSLQDGFWQEISSDGEESIPVFDGSGLDF